MTDLHLSQLREIAREAQAVEQGWTGRRDDLRKADAITAFRLAFTPSVALALLAENPAGQASEPESRK